MIRALLLVTVALTLPQPSLAAETAQPNIVLTSSTIWDTAI